MEGNNVARFMLFARTYTFIITRENSFFLIKNYTTNCWMVYIYLYLRRFHSSRSVKSLFSSRLYKIFVYVYRFTNASPHTIYNQSMSSLGCLLFCCLTVVRKWMFDKKKSIFSII